MWSVVGLLILVILLLSKCNKTQEETINLYNHIGDSTKHYRDKYGLEHAENTVLEASHTSLLLSLKTSDSLVLELQSKVRQFKKELKGDGSVTIFHTRDTVYKETITNVSFPVNDSCNPKYSTTFKDKFLHYTIDAYKDSTKFQLETFHDYSVVIGSKRDKWYKKKHTFVDVSDTNPYTSIKSLKAFEVKDKSKSHFSFGIQGGYGITPTGLQPYIGIGGQFKLFEL
jgi:hypothetical protein